MVRVPRVRKQTRGQRVIAFIEKYCRVPEGKHVGKPMLLMKFQKKFILNVYDNKAGTARAYLSLARKNGKTALIACLVLAHLVGPEAILNTQIVSGARSRKQAAILFKLAEKMVHLNPDLGKIIKITSSEKLLTGLPMNVEYQAISAEAGTAHGLSPVLAILDEVGQVKGPTDAFVEAIETAQGAHAHPLLIAISTQAPTDNDLFSIWIDDALNSKDPRIICHLYTAPEEAELDNTKAWKAANPALGEFRGLEDLQDMSARAMRQPSLENSFRWLFLNQRVEGQSPFIAKGVWKACGSPVHGEVIGGVYGGLDLSSVNDLTAKVWINPLGGKLHVHPVFWLPEFGLREKSQSDRVPYDLWHKQNYLRTTPGKTVDYEFVAATLYADCEHMDVRKIAFDRWNWKHLRPWLLKVGFSESQLEGDNAIFVQYGQGYQSMSPALRDLEVDLLDGRIVHGDHPVLTMCAANAVVTMDPAGNRKLDKSKANGRIDGMVALAMARGALGTYDGDAFMSISDLLQYAPMIG